MRTIIRLIVYIALIAATSAACALSGYAIIKYAEDNVNADNGNQQAEQLEILVEPEFTPPEPTKPEQEEDRLALSNISESQKAALSKAIARTYTIPYSHVKLVNQLMEDGFSFEDAKFAADNCGADWNENAVWRVDVYFDIRPFSYKMLVNQLEYDGFTEDEIEYAAENRGKDWNEQAVIMAKACIRSGMDNKMRIIGYLEEHGFEDEQINYAMRKVWFAG